MMQLKPIVLAATLACVSGASAENWPAFRGPHGDGHANATELPLTWSQSENVAWKQTIPGEGWSSPTLVDGKLYLTSAVTEEEGTPPTLSLHVLSLAAADGKVLWNTKVFFRSGEEVNKKHKKNGYASPTPLIEGDRIYVHFGHMGTACLNLQGKVLWRQESLTYSPVHGNGGSPIIVGDILFFACDGGENPFAVALDKRNGDILWKKPRQTDASRKFSFSTATAIQVNGQTQIISPASGAVFAYDPKTGDEIWHCNYGEGYSVIPKPVYGHGLLFVATGYNKPNLMAIRPGGHGDVTDTHVAWTVTRSVPHTPSLLLVGDELYMVADSGIATCLDAKTGEEHWSERVGGGYSSSPVYADGKIYFQNEEGKTTVVAPGKEFKVLATSELGERTLASYAVGEHELYIRSAEHLYRIQQGGE